MMMRIFCRATKQQRHTLYGKGGACFLSPYPADYPHKNAFLGPSRNFPRIFCTQMQKMVFKNF
jgi:hypothetical protein